MIYYKAVFELFQKLYLQIYASQFMTSQIIPRPFVRLSLESVERNEKKKTEKFERKENENENENEKSFLDEIKNIFIHLEGISFGEKIKV